MTNEKLEQMLDELVRPALKAHGGDVELCRSSSTCCRRCGQKACVDCEHGTSPQCKINVTR